MLRQLSRIVSGTVTLLVIGTLPALAQTPRYTITYLGTLPNPPATTPNSRAYDLNESGTIVGLSSVPGNSNGFVYSNETFSGIGALETGRYSELRAINESSLAVGYGSRTYTGNIVDTALYWTEATGPVALPFLSSNGAVPRRAQAADVNDSGVIVGNANDLNAANSSVARAVVWDSINATAPTRLNGFFADAQGSATSINNAGQIAGNSQFASTSTVRRAALWNSTTQQPTDISALAASLGFVDVAGNAITGRTLDLNTTASVAAINDQGSLIGGFRYQNNGTNESSNRAFFYDAPNNRFVDFGLTPSFSLSANPFALSVARGLNDFGAVVGNFNNTDGDQAFLYSNGSLLNLNTPGLIDPTSFAASNFTVLRQAWAINNNGDIVGFASVNGGGVGAFRLSLIAVAPEPGVLALMLPVSCLLIRRRKKTQ